MYIETLHSSFLNFCIDSNAILRSILQLCKLSRQIYSYSKRFTNEFILQIYLILIYFFSVSIFVTFFLYFSHFVFFFKNFFSFDTLFSEIQVIFINCSIPDQLAKKSGKIYFIKHSLQHIDLSHRLMLRVTTTLFNIPSH